MSSSHGSSPSCLVTARLRRSASRFSLDCDLEELNKTSGLRNGDARRRHDRCSGSENCDAVVDELTTAVCELGTVLSRVYYSEGSMETGEKVIVMQVTRATWNVHDRVGSLFVQGAASNDQGRGSMHRVPSIVRAARAECNVR